MIHPTTIIDANAKLHATVQVGAYSVIGPDVEIQEDTKIQHHVVMEGPTRIGKKCRIFPFASIGLEPQDKKYDGERSHLEIGDGNTIREYVTISRGTAGGGGTTKIGKDGWIMAYCHIAHDCILGSNIVMSNGATLGGHVVVGEHAVIGGLTGIHQFCRVGDYSITGAQSMIRQDIAPFSMVAGNRAHLSGVNYVGLRRNGFTQEEIKDVKSAFSIFFQSSLTKKEAVQKLRDRFPHSPHITLFIDFVDSSERGVCR